ncbi:MAG: hypothetical protein K0S14_1867, partial [Thermomicrobiales bacterium]|nr:hypothetical protein [Thermomicrobiales bacterium]
RNNRRRNTNNNQNTNNQNTNNKNTNKNQNPGPGTGRPLNCPDAYIDCWKTDDAGNCEDVVLTLGPVGRCGQGLSCCPCGHADQQYWTDQCNQQAACQTGNNCIASDSGMFSCFVCLV